MREDEWQVGSLSDVKQHLHFQLSHNVCLYNCLHCAVAYIYLCSNFIKHGFKIANLCYEYLKHKYLADTPVNQHKTCIVFSDNYM